MQPRTRMAYRQLVEDLSSLKQQEIPPPSPDSARRTVSGSSLLSSVFPPRTSRVFGQQCCCAIHLWNVCCLIFLRISSSTSTGSADIHPGLESPLRHHGKLTVGHFTMATEMSWFFETSSMYQAFLEVLDAQLTHLKRAFAPSQGLSFSLDISGSPFDSCIFPDIPVLMLRCVLGVGFVLQTFLSTPTSSNALSFSVETVNNLPYRAGIQSPIQF